MGIMHHLFLNLSGGENVAVKIRLTRLGKKKKPFYRLVAATSTTPRDGKQLEVIGQYDPTKNPVFFQYQKDRVEYWLSVGAQPTETVHRLLAKEGVLPSVTRTSAKLGVSKKDRKSQEK
jgi:small subunit ribosomal protein S16